LAGGHVYVNANTGEVIGERPYACVKITAAVVAALVVIHGQREHPDPDRAPRAR